MQPFSDYCLADTSFKEADGKQSKALADAQAAHDAFKNYNGNDSNQNVTLREKNDQSQAALLDATSQVKSIQTILRTKYEADEQKEAGMKTGNPLGVNSGGSNALKSLADVFRDSDIYKGLPDQEYGGVKIPGLKNWKALGQDKMLQVAKDVSPAKYDPRLALKSEQWLQQYWERAAKAGEITTTAFPTFYQPLPTIVPMALYPANLLDEIPTFVALNKTITWRQETSLTRNEAATAETSTPTASTFAFTLEQAIAHMVKGKMRVTEEEIMDLGAGVEFMTFEANRDLRRTVEGEILTGNNTGEHLNGIYNQASGAFILGTTAPTTDTNGDAVTGIDAWGYAVQSLKITGVCIPDMAVINPHNVMPLRQIKNKFGDYILGPPSQPLTQLWGTRIVESIEATDQQVLLGDFRGYYSLGINQGISIELLYSADDAEKWMRTLRYSMRCVNQVRRTAAFSILSNMPTQA